MFQRLARLLVLIGAVQIVGGHWAVLQAVAGTKMLVDYSQQDSLTVAVARTFDGKHPCQLCHTVKQVRQEEQKKQTPMAIAKLEAVLPPAIQIPPRPKAPRLFFSVAQQRREVALSPLIPPPRAA